MSGPMRSGGIDTDIRTGRPIVVPPPGAKDDLVRQRFESAVQDAWAISSELHENKVILRIFLERYAKRLMMLAETDEICQGLEAPIRAIRETLEVRPVMAEREALRRLGPQLAALAQDTDAAP